MRSENGVLRRIEDGKPAFGAAVLTGSPTLVEALGDAGLEFVWIDLEHGLGSPTNATRLEHLTRAAEAGGTELLVRVPRPDPAVVRKVLDAGVHNVLVPRVETAAAVRRAVAAGRFDHDGDVGDRGMALARANGWGAEMGGYAARADASVLVGAMVENERAVENLPEILAVPDLGFVFVGPADLAVSMGHAGNPGHPAVRARIEDVERAADEADVQLAGIAFDGEAVPSMVETGYDVVVVGSDVEAVRGMVDERLAPVD